MATEALSSQIQDKGGRRPPLYFRRPVAKVFKPSLAAGRGGGRGALSRALRSLGQLDKRKASGEE